MQELKLKKNEPYTLKSEKSEKLTIYASTPLIVLFNGSPLTPLPGGGDMPVYQARCRVGDEVDFVPSGKDVTISVISQPLSSVYDPVDPTSIVETLAPEEMNIYDKLRGEVLAMLSQFADKNNLDTIDEADDLEFEDDDESLIRTPYEYEDMIEEYPVETPPIEAPEGNSDSPVNGEQPPAPADASGAAASASGESAPVDER